MLLITHALCLQHDPGDGHPESPARLRAVLEALAHDRFAALDRVEARAATRDELARVHAPAQIEQVTGAVPEFGLAYVDADTGLSPLSLDAALRAAGALCMGVDAVLDGRATRVFCAVRPPGHHATREAAMGFCLFNNVAVGAARALERGIERVAIVDFDVHHGNGTQDIFWNEPRVLYVSTHQSPLYPGTGAREESGSAHNVLNAPLAPGAGSAEFRRVCSEQVLPALDAFRPQLLLVSAGFDAHKLDPLANLNLDTDDYRWITEELVAIALRYGEGRVVSTLEGGYSLTALRQGVTAHVGALLEGE